jgi:hypothetical protein
LTDNAQPAPGHGLPPGLGDALAADLAVGEGLPGVIVVHTAHGSQTLLKEIKLACLGAIYDVGHGQHLSLFCNASPTAWTTEITSMAVTIQHPTVSQRPDKGHKTRRRSHAATKATKTAGRGITHRIIQAGSLMIHP